MQLAMVGLGRMGGNMVERLQAGGHQCVVYDRNTAATEAARATGARTASSTTDLIAYLSPPRIVWLMIPAAAVDAMLDELTPLLSRGDVVIDGGNSHYRESMGRAARLDASGIHFVDVGTSGGVHGRRAGYCQMVGGDSDTVEVLRPLFEALAVGTENRAAYRHCGPAGSGHFVKMVHNAIEYGIMQAYAEGFELLARGPAPADPGAPPLDLAGIAELWRHGSVVRSWLLDLTAEALAEDPTLERFGGSVSDSGEGRWALEAAADRGVPVPALAAALFTRFRSSGGSDYADRVLSAMRHGFGGHQPGGPSR